MNCFYFYFYFYGPVLRQCQCQAMPIDLRVHPRVGHSENNTASPPRHRESPIIHIQKRHHNTSSGDCPSGGGDDDNHDNDSDTDRNCSLPLLHRDNCNSNNHRPNIGRGVGGKKRKFILHYIISLLLLFAFRFISGSVLFRQHPSSTSTDATLYGLPSNTTNPFIARYEHALLNKNLGSDLFIPLLYENGKLLCRRNHKSQLSRYRTRYFAQMVRTGLVVASKGTKQQQRKQHLHDNDGTNDNTTSFHITSTLNNYDDGLPMLVMDGDDNGCNIQQHIDTYNFPRLTWSDLSLKHTTKTDTIHNRTTTTTNHHEHQQSSSCNTISMPSYETYKYYHRSHRTYRDWEHTFANNAQNYPFTTKIPKAVWRGSTTYEGSQYTGSELQNTPRGQLVLIGKEREDMMDVGFHKILQQYAEDSEELAKRFTMKRRMHPMDMMRYRGTFTGVLLLLLSSFVQKCTFLTH